MPTELHIPRHVWKNVCLDEQSHHFDQHIETDPHCTIYNPDLVVSGSELFGKPGQNLNLDNSDLD